MANDHIYPGRKFAHCHPLDSTTLIVREYNGGDRVKVADVRGRNVRWISAKQIRPSATKPNGEPYKTGYAPA